MEGPNHRLDKALGLDKVMTRRDFLNGALLGAGGVWAATLTPMEIFTTRPRREIELLPDRWSGNTEDQFSVGHQVRDGVYDDAGVTAEDTGEAFDLVIVGGGFSGLGAAYFFNQAKDGRAKILILDNQQVCGGNARRDEFSVKGKTLYAPQGSIVAQDLPPALSPPPPVESLFKDLKVDFDRIRVPKEASDFAVLWDQQSHGVQAKWYPNVFEAPLSPAVKKDFMAFAESAGGFYAGRDWKSDLRRLDQHTFKDYVEKEQKWDPGLYRTMVPDLASFFGFPDQVSAAAVYAQYGGGPRSLYSFPGGNSGFLRYLTRGLIPDAISGGASQRAIVEGPLNYSALDRPSNPVRIRTGATAVRVEHEGPPDKASRVRVTFSRGGKLYRLHARSVIMAGGGYITQHVVRDLPSEKIEAYRRFRYVPVLWINVALNNSRALDRAGVNFLSTYDEGFGVMLALYEKMSAAGLDPRRDPNRPNVIGIGAPRFYPGLPPQAQAVKGRTEMLETSFRDYERQTREELVRLLGPWGFNPATDIEGIAISRWGHHGYIFPYPGFFTNEFVEVAKKPYGRIAFAHTDLDRFSHMMGALAQGHRAVQDILQRT